MEVTLKVTVEQKDRDGNTILKLKEGTRVKTIRWTYLPSCSKEILIKSRSEQSIKENFYVIYYRGQFILVNKGDCHVNKWEAGKYNI